MKKTPILPLALAAATVALLAGCTTASDTSTTKPATTSPTASTPATASDDSQKLLEHRNQCADGMATITEDTTLEKGCDEVAILASDITVTLSGTVETLYIEGDGNTITADTVKTVNATGSTGNKLTFTGSAPEVKDAGTGNSITKKE